MLTGFAAGRTARRWLWLSRDRPWTPLQGGLPWIQCLKTQTIRWAGSQSRSVGVVGLADRAGRLGWLGWLACDSVRRPAASGHVLLFHTYLCGPVFYSMFRSMFISCLMESCKSG